MNKCRTQQLKPVHQQANTRFWKKEKKERKNIQIALLVMIKLD